MTTFNCIKVLTIASSISLSSTFIIYRGGYLDSFFYPSITALQTSSNGGAFIKKPTDSLPLKNIRLPRRFSSSKSIVLTDNINFNHDSIKVKTDSLKQQKEQLRLMTSSKFGIMIEPAMAVPDSIRKALQLKKAIQKITP